MDLKKSVESHPFTYLLSCMIAAASLTAGAQQYFATQEITLLKGRYESQVNDLNSKMASLRRGIPGSEFFDVRKVLYYSGTTENAPPKASTFFDKEEFYAPTGPGDWEHKETTELDLGADMAGVSPKSIPGGLKGMPSVRLHLWKSRKELRVEGHDAFKKLYPLITVQKVSNEQMRTIEGMPTPSDELLKKGSTAKEAVDTLDRAFRNYMIGTYFTTQLQAQSQAATKSPQTSFALMEIQKIQNVLYAQFVTTLKKVNVEGQPYDKYYLTREIIVITTGDGAVIVGTSVPHWEPSHGDPFFVAVTKWLSEFRVVMPQAGGGTPAQ